jgi:serine/threonine-protein kinase RsbW
VVIALRLPEQLPEPKFGLTFGSNYNPEVVFSPGATFNSELKICSGFSFTAQCNAKNRLASNNESLDTELGVPELGVPEYAAISPEKTNIDFQNSFDSPEISLAQNKIDSSKSNLNQSKSNNSTPKKSQSEESNHDLPGFNQLNSIKPGYTCSIFEFNLFENLNQDNLNQDNLNQDNLNQVSNKSFNCIPNNIGYRLNNILNIPYPLSQDPLSQDIFPLSSGHNPKKFQPNFNSKYRKNFKLAECSRVNQAPFIWKTITFASTLQLSQILENLLSHIPRFWQAELRLGLQEALVNAVKHGNQIDSSKQIKISFTTKGNCYWWIIEDQGSEFDRNRSITNHLSEIPCLEQDASECGRGLYILRQVFNRVHWDQQKHQLYLFKQINPFDLPCVV